MYSVWWLWNGVSEGWRPLSVLAGSLPLFGSRTDPCAGEPVQVAEQLINIGGQGFQRLNDKTPVGRLLTNQNAQRREIPQLDRGKL